MLATRHDVRLGLHRLRLEGELAEIREPDLRFTVAEARELFESAGVELPDPVSPVIDWAAARPEGDPGRIALFGLSMGGGLAPRAAAFAPRISALICIDGIYDMGRAYTASLGLGADTERRLTAESDPELDAALAQLMHTSSQVRWVCRQGMWSFGVGTPRALLAASLAYTLRGGIAEKITCPVFVGRAESDEFLLGQPEELVRHLTAPATLASFTDGEGAGAHAQVGAQRLLCARMLDWLDETLAT